MWDDGRTGYDREHVDRDDRDDLRDDCHGPLPRQLWDPSLGRYVWVVDDLDDFSPHESRTNDVKERLGNEP